MIVDHQDYVTDWKTLRSHFAGAKCYRIWIRKTPWGNFQRHEWKGGDDEPSWSEDWIRATRSPLGANFSPVPGEDAVFKALREIAEGHNDPRALARETLASYEQEKVR